MSKIDQDGVSSLVHLKHFETYFFLFCNGNFFIKLSNHNRNYLLLKQLTNWESKYQLPFLLYAETLYHFVMIFIYMYIACIGL